MRQFSLADRQSRLWFESQECYSASRTIPRPRVKRRQSSLQVLNLVRHLKDQSQVGSSRVASWINQRQTTSLTLRQLLPCIMGGCGVFGPANGDAHPPYFGLRWTAMGNGIACRK